MPERYLFYRDRPEWSDITPIPQDAVNRNVLNIAYSQEFVDANDYFRAVLLKDERSERALELSRDIVLLNPANYTAWEYRRRLLESLNSDLEGELEFVNGILNDHPKNYQLWHHRQWLATKLAQKANSDARHNIGEIELAFIRTVHSDDPKNHHSWQYRRWLVDYFDISPSSELAYTDFLINEDVFNNSAWNHRFVVVTKNEHLTPPVLQREIAYVQAMIRKAPSNESSWNYLYGLLTPPPCLVAASGSTTGKRAVAARPDGPQAVNSPADAAIADDAVGVSRLVIVPPPVANLRAMRAFAEDLAAGDKNANNSTALLSFLMEIYSDCLQVKVNSFTADCSEKTSLASAENSTGDEDKGESVEDLLELADSTCQRLAVEVDRIRASYWRYRSRQIANIAEPVFGKNSSVQ